MLASVERSQTSLPIASCRPSIWRLSRNTLWNAGPRRWRRIVSVIEVSISDAIHGSGWSRLTTLLLTRSAKYSTPEVTVRSEEHTSELQSRPHLVCRLLLEKKKKRTQRDIFSKKKKKINNQN